MTICSLKMQAKNDALDAADQAAKSGNYALIDPPRGWCPHHPITMSGEDNGQEVGDNV